LASKWEGHEGVPVKTQEKVSPVGQDLFGLLRIQGFVLERMATPQSGSILLSAGVAVLLSLLLAALPLIAMEIDPLRVYVKTFTRVFGTTYGISETAVKAVPVMLGAMAVALAGRAGLWNIGTEGQFYVGAIAATGVALFVKWDLPPFFMLALMLVAGFFAGAMLGFLSALPRAFLNVPEIITTLFPWYMIVLWVAHLTQGPWKNPETHIPQTSVFPENAIFPQFGSTRLTASLIIAVIIILAVNWILHRTTWGFELRVLGNKRTAAEYAGIPQVSSILIVMALSGGLAGIAGMLEVSSVVHQLQNDIFPGYLFTTCTVAWLARLNVWGIMIVSYLVAGLFVGGFVMQIFGMPDALARVIQGLILLLIMGFDLLTYYRVRVRKRII
jgi:simple sugar transport system permease protein